MNTFKGDFLIKMLVNLMILMSPFMSNAEELCNESLGNCYSILIPRPDLPPELTVIGPEIIYTFAHNEYFDPGATAYDINFDGNITGRIQVITALNTAVEGVYTVNYLVKDKIGQSDEGTRTVVVVPSPVMTNAGDDDTVNEGSIVLLKGSKSIDSYGYYPLSYNWQIVEKPSGSHAQLDQPTSTNPTFIADVAGRYKISLQASNTHGIKGNIDDVVITALEIASEPTISDLVQLHINDELLASCVMDYATSKNWHSPAQVIELHCNGLNIVNLSGLEVFDKLQLLSLQHNKITDLTPLSNLTELQRLFISHNQIVNLSPLEQLVQIQHLTLAHNNITNVLAIANLTELRTLHLHNNAIENISALNGLTVLKKLSLSNTLVRDISVLANLNQLQRLELSKLQLTDISALSGLSQLELLDLNLNQLSDISPLANLVNLHTLYLAFNQIENIDSLSFMNYLSVLLLNVNNLTDISPISNLKALKILDLKYNSQLQDVIELSQLDALTRLDLSGLHGVLCGDLTILEEMLGSNIVERSSSSCI